MKIAISCESTNDLTKELLVEYDIKVIPFHITLGDMEFEDGAHTTSEIFGYVDKYNTLPKTTALNEYQYTEFFKSLKKDYDAVIHVSLSSGITSTTNNAFKASNNVENVYVVDSLSLSTGIGILCMYARELANAGLSPKEIQSKVQQRAHKLHGSFVIERLDYLYKGGRCTSLQLFGANILKIRPSIILKEGKMVMDKKYRGNMGSVVSKYCNETLATYNTPDLDKVFLTYTSATEEMLNVAETALKNAGFKKIYKSFAGGTIASHCGANTLGFFFFNDGTK